jgi:hypothetical protein
VRVIADAQALHRLGEDLRGGQHEVQARMRRRELVLDVHERGPRNVRLLEICAPRHHLVQGQIRQRRQMCRRVEHPHIGIVEVLGEPLRGDQVFGV